MANFDRSKVKVDCPNVSHVRHVQDSNNCRLPFWRKQNIPKRQREPPHPSQRHTGKPPTLLRLDSAGESVEEYPHRTHYSPRRHAPGGRSGRGRPNAIPSTTSNSFFGNIWSKVGYPLHSHQVQGGGYLAKTSGSTTQQESDFNLDRLTEKLTSCDLEQKQQNQMASQAYFEQPPMQPAKVVAPMTFTGGPYVTWWSSQGNGTRTFPAYYRFLSNFVHFHPYNNATRMNRSQGPPFIQPQHVWSNVTQFHQHSPHKQCNPTKVNHPPKFPRNTNHQREFKQFCGGNTKGNARVMQNKQAVSHQNEHRTSSTTPKVASPHTADENKGLVKHFEKCRLKAAQTSSALIKTEKSSLPCNERLLHKDTCQQGKVHPYEMPCAMLSDSKDMCMSTKPCANSGPDNVSSNQEGHKRSKTRTDSLSVAVCENKCLSKKFCSKSNEQKVCNSNRSATTTSNVCPNLATKPHHEQTEKSSAKESTDTSSSSSTGASKEMHSSIAYLLGNYVDNTAGAGSNDSDFSEVDEDFDEEIGLDDVSRELLESFQTDDPYNPMYGWKCLPSNSKADGTFSKDPLTMQEASDAIEESSLALNDSGLSVVEQSEEITSTLSTESSGDDSEDSEDSYVSSSDEWSDSGCDEEEQKIWDSLNRCSDPYDPMGGWRLQSSSVVKATKSTDVQESITVSPSKNSCSSPVRSNLQLLNLHEISNNSSSTKHPSVSFILGADDDSDSDSPDESNNEETNDSQDSSANYEDLWRSFQTSSDPYNPINGWQCHSPSSSSLHRSASSPSELCSFFADKEDQNELTPLKMSPSSDDHPDGGQQTPVSPSNISLIQSSSTGCLKTVWKKAIQRDKERKKKVCKLRQI